MTRYIVLLEPGVWLADLSGDPGRALVEANAKRYRTKRSAQSALSNARRYQMFWGAQIIPIEDNS